MRNSKLFLPMFAAAVSLTCRGAQFTNLGFDEADISDLSPGGGRPQGSAPTAKVLPGWDLYWGQVRYSEIYVNMEFDSSTVWAALRDSEVTGNFALDL
jgi:hypothetical protein